MGAYTWTFVRVDKLTPEMVKSCIGHAKWLATGTTYESYSKMDFESALKDWFKLHKEEHDYLVNECKVPLEKLTKEYLTKELKEKIKNHKKKLEYYEKCLAGEMTVEELLHKTNTIKKINDLYVIKRQGHYYVNIEKEVFRNYEYCDEEFHTVESLIEHCRNNKGNNYIDYTKDYDEYHEWNDEIEKTVRDYYESIGDNNFYVHFG